MLLAGAGRRSGKFRNNVEQPHASNARLPFMPVQSCLATRIGPGAGTVWSAPGPGAHWQVATATERRTRHPRRPPRLGGHVAYVARRGRGSLRGAIRELGLVGIKKIWERDFGRERAAVRETGGADRGNGNACPS